MSRYDFRYDVPEHEHTNGEHSYVLDPRMMNLDHPIDFGAPEPSTNAMNTDPHLINAMQPNTANREVVKVESEGGEYCICRKGDEGDMVCCEKCEEWFHGECIGIDRDMAKRLPHFVCHTCNGATLEENLEIHTATLLSKKRSRRGATAMEEQEPTPLESTPDESRRSSSRKSKEKAEQILSTKKVASAKKAGASAAPPSTVDTPSPAPTITKAITKKAGQESASTSMAKKRSRLDEESEATVAKKPKLKENESSTTQSEEKHRVVVPSQPKKEKPSLTPLRAPSGPSGKALTKHRLGFRNSILSMMLAVVNGPDYEAAEAEARSISGTSLSVPKPSEQVLQDLSADVEAVWFEKCGKDSESEAYTESLRSLRFSLKQNPTLIARLVHRTLDPRTLSKMSAEEMAPAKARAALLELRQEDAMSRSRVAETEGESKLAKDMFQIRGKTDDRIIGTLPTFVAPAPEEDDLGDLISPHLADGNAVIGGSGGVGGLGGSVPSSARSGSDHNAGTPRGAGLTSSSSSLASSNMDFSASAKNAGSTSKLSESGLGLSSDALIAPQVDPSILASSKKVDIDLDAFDVPQLKLSTTHATPEPTVHIQHQTQAPKPTHRRADSEIRSILDEIKFDSGEAPDRQESRESHYDPEAAQGYGPSDEDRTDNTVNRSETFTKSSHSQSHSNGHKTFTIHEPEDNDVGEVWRGMITPQPGSAPPAQVILRPVNGPRVDGVLRRIPVTNFEVHSLHDLKSIMGYLRQLDRSSSRCHSLLYFEPVAGDAAAEKAYREFFQYLHGESKTSVMNVKGAIANDGHLKELYVLPIKAGDSTFSNVIPVSSMSFSQDRLYLSVVSDKKKMEKLQSEASAAPSSSPPVSTASRALSGSTARGSPSSVLGSPSSAGPSPPAILGGSVPAVLGGGSSAMMLGGANVPGGNFMPPLPMHGAPLGGSLGGPPPSANLPPPPSIPNLASMLGGAGPSTRGPSGPTPPFQGGPLSSGSLPPLGPVHSHPHHHHSHHPHHAPPPMQGPPSRYDMPNYGRGPAPPPNYGAPPPMPSGSRYDPYGPPPPFADAPRAEMPPYGGSGGGMPPRGPANAPNYAPFGRGPSPMGGHNMPPAPSPSSSAPGANQYQPPAHYRGPPQQQLPYPPPPAGTQPPPSHMPPAQYPPQGPPPSQAAQAATSFLDSLKGVDLSNLLGAPRP